MQQDSHDFVGRDVFEELGQLGIDPVENEVLEIMQQLVLKKDTGSQTAETRHQHTLSYYSSSIPMSVFVKPVLKFGSKVLFLSLSLSLSRLFVFYYVFVM